jgi:hypothetical protein
MKSEDPPVSVYEATASGFDVHSERRFALIRLSTRYWARGDVQSTISTASLPVRRTQSPGLGIARIVAAREDGGDDDHDQDQR